MGQWCSRTTHGKPHEQDSWTADCQPPSAPAGASNGVEGGRRISAGLALAEKTWLQCDFGSELYWGGSPVAALAWLNLSA